MSNAGRIRPERPAERLRHQIYRTRIAYFLENEDYWLYLHTVSYPATGQRDTTVRWPSG